MFFREIPNALPAPKICDCCGSINVSLCKNDVLYKELKGTWPYIYFCSDCEAAVACHPNTDIPCGIMAGKETRFLRAKLHGCFDPIWKTGLMYRNMAYKWLASILGIQSINCHIGQLTNEQMEKAIIEASIFLNERRLIIVRRVKKNEQRNNKEFNRVRRYIESRKRNH